ncbi:MAG: acetoacetate--CoA ligase [Magnetospiraceae bacterium]
MEKPLWTPTAAQIGAANLRRFMEDVESDWNITLDSYESLQRWSVDRPDKFWQSVKDFANLAAETWGETVIENPTAMPGARFFPDAKLNFAENLLQRRDDADALVFWGEDKVKRKISFRQLYDQVSQLSQVLTGMGVQPGDRIAAIVANMPEAIIGMLAASSIGAVWSSCSPDFGEQGILDRFGQIAPVALISVDGYHYNGKTHDVLGKLAAILPQIPSVRQCLVIPYARTAPDLSALPDYAVALDTAMAAQEPGEIDFLRLPFNHPLYILYSSGTTGVPKCIVHGAGGTLLQHAKEHRLHCDIKPDDRVFYFTTCGWMMWNWLATVLACQATLLLYDGSPFYPNGNILFDFADAEDMTLFGTSAKYIDALNKAGLRPKDTHQLASLRTMTSTGSPLAPESFDYVYDAIKEDMHLASIAGGTDIVSCFVGGNPLAPVWRGEIQCAALGMKVAIYDENGNALPPNEKGELVCEVPFPSMPVKFWNDPDGAKYKAAYFEKFPNVWTHGDWISWTDHGGLVIHGRSDATLNPGGVRIGTAEIYRQVEKLNEVVESIVIGQDWDNDVRVVLFVILRAGLTLDDDLRDRIKKQIRANCTPRHVPARIVQVSDIPRTKSGKITELAVRDVVHGRLVKNKEALANPAALDLYANLPDLAK